MLQGLSRVRLNRVISEAPYRLFDISPLKTHASCKEENEVQIRQEQFLSLVKAKETLGSSYPPEVRRIFEKLQNIDMLADLASHIFCSDEGERQELLETTDSSQRLDKLMKSMRKDIAALRLNQELQGHLTDDDIPTN